MSAAGQVTPRGNQCGGGEGEGCSPHALVPLTSFLPASFPTLHLPPYPLVSSFSSHPNHVHCTHTSHHPCTHFFFFLLFSLFLFLLPPRSLHLVTHHLLRSPTHLPFLLYSSFPSLLHPLPLCTSRILLLPPHSLSFLPFSFPHTNPS